MPLEVLGAAGATVTVQVPAANGSSATKLYMQVNNLSYDNKGWVKVNDGPWVALTNAAVTVLGAGASYGGIGGGFDTIKLTVPITGAVNGTNTVSFQFHQGDGISAGYRVLDFNLEDDAGDELVDASTFSQDDPTLWVAPDNNATDIAAGKTLWESATLEASPLNTAALQAHCMDCHTANGSDLQRFNYSNYSIVTRSEYHGLSEAQGLQIASYIRSLTATLGVPGTNCRPWNPPYQPGPGLDAGDVKNWTCGAGLGYVSDSDLDTLNYIFPNGITDATSMQSAIDPAGHLNAREIPISLQLPDWNHWLPRVAPIDAWGSYFTNSALNLQYNNPNGITPTTGTGGGTITNIYAMRQKLTSGGAAYAQGTSGTIFNDLYYWGVALGEDFAPTTALNTTGGMGTTGSYTIPQQENLYSTYQWQLVKAWELAEDFNLDTYCPTAWVNQANAPTSKVEARGWCGYWRFAEDVSPHNLSFPANNSMFGSALAQWTRGNQWYYMQLLLNPGNGAHNVHLPLDWQYAYGVFGDLSKQSGRQEPIRHLLFMIKGAQEMDNGVGVKTVNTGWTTRDTSPFDVWGGGQSGIWSGVALSTEQAVVNAYLQNWVNVSTYYATGSNPISAWQRLGDSNDLTSGETTVAATSSGGTYTGDACIWAVRSLCAAGTNPATLLVQTPGLVSFPTDAWTDIPLMRSEGISTTALSGMDSWLEIAYPNVGYATR